MKDSDPGPGQDMLVLTACLFFPKPTQKMNSSHSVHPEDSAKPEKAHSPLAFPKITVEDEIKPLCFLTGLHKTSGAPHLDWSRQNHPGRQARTTASFPRFAQNQGNLTLSLAFLKIIVRTGWNQCVIPQICTKPEKFHMLSVFLKTTVEDKKESVCLFTDLRKTREISHSVSFSQNHHGGQDRITVSFPKTWVSGGSSKTQQKFGKFLGIFWKFPRKKAKKKSRFFTLPALMYVV